MHFIVITGKQKKPTFRNHTYQKTMFLEIAISKILIF